MEILKGHYHSDTKNLHWISKNLWNSEFQVRADSFDEPAAQSAAAPVEDDGWATWDDAPAANAEPEPVAANDNEDWAAFDQQPEVVQEEAPQAPAEVHDTEGLKQVTVLYNFDAQNGDELTITENEVVYLSNEECDEEGWAVCINAQGQKGYVPCNYLELEEQAAAESADQNEVADGSNHQEPYVEPVRPEPEEVPWETSWPGMQPSEPAQQPSQPPPMPVGKCTFAPRRDRSLLKILSKLQKANHRGNYKVTRKTVQMKMRMKKSPEQQNPSPHPRAHPHPFRIVRLPFTSFPRATPFPLMVACRLSVIRIIAKACTITRPRARMRSHLTLVIESKFSIEYLMGWMMGGGKVWSNLETLRERLDSFLPSSLSL